MKCNIEKEDNVNSYIQILRNSNIIYNNQRTDESEINIEYDYDDSITESSDYDDNVTEIVDIYGLLH